MKRSEYIDQITADAIEAAKDLDLTGAADRDGLVELLNDEPLPTTPSPATARAPTPSAQTRRPATSSATSTGASFSRRFTRSSAATWPTPCATPSPPTWRSAATCSASASRRSPTPSRSPASGRPRSSAGAAPPALLSGERRGGRTRGPAAREFRTWGGGADRMDAFTAVVEAFRLVIEAVRVALDIWRESRDARQ